MRVLARSLSYTTRKNIARVLTVVNQAQKAALRRKFKHHVLKPLDLREKKTRCVATRRERAHLC